LNSVEDKIRDMKKLASIIIITLFICQPVNAQYLGLKGGLTFSRMNVGTAVEENLRFGYHAGAFYNIPLSTSFSIQPEVLFTTKGTRAEFDLLDNTGTATLRLNYIDVPVFAVLELGEKFEIMAGPYMGFLLSANFLAEVDNSFNTDINRESLRGFDYGAALGFGLNFGAIQTGAAYYFGLQDLSEDYGANYILGDPRNRYLQLFIAFRIGNYSRDDMQQ
jgi:hypothetical protein